MLRVELPMKSTNILISECVAAIGATSQRLRQFQIRAIQDAVGVADVLDLLLIEATPLESFGIDHVRLGRIARDHDVRRHIALDDRAAGKKSMGADLHELMHGCESTEDDPIADLNVTGQSCAVGKHHLVAHMQSCATCEYAMNRLSLPIRVTPCAMSGAAIHRAALTKHVAVADLQPRRLAVVFLVLGRIADGGKLEDAVVGADARSGR